MKIGKWTARTLLVSAACLSFLTSGHVVADGKDGEGAVLEVSSDGKSARLRVSGAKDVSYEKLDFEKLKVKMDGAGDVKLEGKVKTLEIDISGSGEIDAEGLETEDVEIDLSGHSKVRVTASKSVEIDASGSGRIYVNGTARDLKVRKSGSVRIYDQRRK